MADKQVRIGIVGVGGMGQGHANQCQAIEEAKLTCVCDIDPAVAKTVGEKHNVKYFTDYGDLIRSGLCEAVVIATPHYFHPPVGIAAFKAGLHVLSEKPIAVTVSAAEKLAQAAKKSGKVFSVMYQWRTFAETIAAKKALDSGAIGEIRRATMIDPNYRSQAYYNSGAWRATWKGEGGGVLLNQAPHGIDRFIYLAGMPCEFEGRTATLAHNIEVEDHAEAILRYPNGATGYYYTSTNHPRGHRVVELLGDKGLLRIADGKVELYEFNPPIKKFEAENVAMWATPEFKLKRVRLPKVKGGHGVVLKNFLRAILYGEERITPGEQGVASVEFANAIILSSYKKKPVKIPVDRKEYDELLKKLCKTSKYKKPKFAVVRETDPRLGKP